MIIKGILKSEQELSIDQLAESTSESSEFWKRRLYALIGSDMIRGEYDGSIFVPDDLDSLDDMIDSLFTKFEEYEQEKLGNPVK